MKKSLLSILFILLISPVFSQTTSSSDIDQRLVQYFQNQAYAKAVTYLKSISPADSVNKHYLSLLGYACYMSNQFTEATHYFKQLLYIDSSDGRTQYYLGKINIDKGNLPLAQKYFCQLIDQKPGIAGYYKQLAWLFQQLGNNAASGWYYQKSYRINPNDPQVTASLASNWITQERYHEADSIIDSALSKDSLQANLLDIRIRSAFLQEDYTLIFPLIRKLKSMHAISARPFLRAAIACYNLKKYDSCIATCQLLDINKMSSTTTYYLQALSYKALKKYKPALSFLNTCIAMSLDSAADNYFSTKGKVLELMHQPSNALKQYDTAYYIFHSPLQLYNKALIYDEKFKNYKTALLYYHRYLKHSGKANTEDEKKIQAFIKKRTLQLEHWERHTEKK